MTPLSITLAVCRVFGVTEAELIGTVRRCPRVSDARTCAMYFHSLNRSRYFNLGDIGRLYNRVDSTVSVALQRHERFMKVDRLYREAVEKVKGMLK